MDIQTDNMDPRIVLLNPPLNETSIKAKKSVLVSSFVGILVVKTSLIPTEVTTLGIQFAPTDQKTFLFSLLALTAYFAVTFLLYTSSDFVRWGLLATKALEARSQEKRLRILRDELGVQNQKLFDEFLATTAFPAEVIREFSITLANEFEESLEKRARIYGALAFPSALIRVVIDFLFPVVFAAYALWLLSVKFTDNV